MLVKVLFLMFKMLWFFHGLSNMLGSKDLGFMYLES